MATVIAIPLLLLSALLQMVAISRLPLVHGSADLVLLVLAAWGIHDKATNAWQWALIGALIISFTSALPWPAIFLPYLTVALLARQLHSRIWRTPIFAMLLVTIAGTLFQHILAFISLQLSNVPIDFSNVLGNITLPSLILNLILALPMYLVIHDVVRWIFPIEDYE